MRAVDRVTRGSEISDPVSGRTQLRRRGRGIGLRGLLVEREAELALLEQRLADARAGAGSVVMLDAPAGNGKSRLLTIAGDMAREALPAVCSELARSC